MQIVIEIDERDFNYCQMLDKYNMGNSVNSAIANGVILPEHHGDIIDVDAVEVIKIEDAQIQYAKGFNAGVNSVISRISKAPILIPANNDD